MGAYDDLVPASSDHGAYGDLVPQPSSSSLGNRALGAAEIAGAGIADIPYGIAHGVSDLAQRIGGNSSPTDPSVVSALQVQPGQAGRQLVSDIANSRAGQAVGHAYSVADAALDRLSPTLHDVVHGAGNVAMDVAGILPGTAALRTAGDIADVAGGALRSSFGEAATPELAAAAARMQQEGVPLTVAQRTGSKGAQALTRAADTMDSQALPFYKQQADAFNRAVLQRIGINASNATPAVMGAAKDRIGAVMDAVASRANIAYDSQLQSDLNTVEHTLARTVPESDRAPLLRNIEDIREAAGGPNGHIGAQLYQQVQRNLDTLRANPALTSAAEDVQEALNDAVNRYASPQDQALLTQARNQYRVLKQVEPAIGPDGDISVNKLMSSISRPRYRNQTIYGQGDQDFATLVKSAKLTIPDALGNSGTAERSIPGAAMLTALAAQHPVLAGLKILAGKFGLQQVARALRANGTAGQAWASALEGLHDPRYAGLAALAAQGQTPAGSQP